MTQIQDFFLSLRESVVTGGSSDAYLVILVLFLVIAVVAVLLVALLRGTTNRGRIESLLEERARGVARPPWVARAVIVAMVLGVILAGDWYMSRDETCLQCHSNSQFAESVASTPHQQVGCADCHRAPGVVGGLQQAIAYSRWLASYAASREVPEPTGDQPLDNRACYRCHDTTGVMTANGIQVRHRDFLDAGANCGDCHNAVSHASGIPNMTQPSMDKCQPCHDGEQASLECGSCHVRDLATRVDPTVFKPVGFEESSADCYQCHEETPCRGCHGVTMPHPAGWSDPQAGGRGTHAREGFANRDACWRCHYAGDDIFQASDEACSCHGLLGRMHGGQAWVREHGLQASGQKTGELADCQICHGGPSFCELCHPASIWDQFNPRPGPDNYVRDIPKPPPDYFDY